jgi:carbonyl reductase 1
LNKLGLNPHYHQLDIDDESSVTRLRDYLQTRYGGLDVLVNNAAIAFKMAATEPFEEQARITLHTNFFNTLRASNILFPLLRPHARVVNVSSSSGHLSRINGEEPAASELRNKLSSPTLTTEELCGLMKNFIE